MVRAHGLPDTLVCDRDPVFTSHFWRRLLELCGILANRSTAFHPQTDGQTERLNSVLEQYLRIYTDYQQSDSASLLPLAEFSYNNSRHSATTISPFFANYGFHPQMSLLPPALASRTPAADSYVAQLREAQDILQRELLKSRKAMEVSANRKRWPAPLFVVGQQVWLLRRHITTTRPSSKLDVRRIGPYLIPYRSLAKSAPQLIDWGCLPPLKSIQSFMSVSWNHMFQTLSREESWPLLQP